VLEDQPSVAGSKSSRPLEEVTRLTTSTAALYRPCREPRGIRPARFGFGPASGLGLKNPFAGVRPDGFVISEEDFMLVVLESDPLSGEVRWHPAFDQPVEGPCGAV
jgi:hypothetical protein